LIAFAPFLVQLNAFAGNLPTQVGRSWLDRCSSSASPVPAKSGMQLNLV
jgi:hypothetical protein